MKHLLSCVALAALPLALPAGTLDSTETTTQPSALDEPEIVAGELGKELDLYLQRLTGLGFSGAAAVSKNGEIVLRRGYGVADRDSNRMVRPDTVFTIGSITKQFTGAAILVLEQRGKLSTDDLASKYFADVPDDKRGITLHHLLTHTAGFPGAIGDDFENPTREQFLAQALATPLLFEPGERYEYSNVGFSLAAIVVELVSGKSYETFVREELFRPAGMERTGYHVPGIGPDDVPVGYRGSERWGTFLERESFMSGPSWHLIGNGGIQSTASDMLRWHDALAGDAILSAASKSKYQARHVDEGFGDSWYGYGWVTQETARGTSLVCHNGGNGVFSADFHRFVDEGVAVYVVSSSSDFFIDPISRTLDRIVFGEPYELPPAVIALESSALDRCCGTYRLSEHDRVTVSRVGGRLSIAAEGDRARSLIAGGDGSGPDARDRALGERSASIVADWIDGDVEPFHEAMGGDMPLEEFVESITNFRRMREDAYGELQSASVVYVVRDGGERRVLMAMTHARGTAYLALGWEGDRLVGIEPLRALPPSSAVLHPIAPDSFTTYSTRGPARAVVRFEPSGEPSREPARSLVFATRSGEVRLER